MWIDFCGVGSALRRSSSDEVDGGSNSYELDYDTITCGVECYDVVSRCMSQRVLARACNFFVTTLFATTDKISGPNPLIWDP